MPGWPGFALTTGPPEPVRLKKKKKRGGGGWIGGLGTGEEVGGGGNLGKGEEVEGGGGCSCILDVVLSGDRP